MEFTSLTQLYRKLLPAFNAKRRLIKNSKYPNITNENIWSYLTETKWRQTNNLSITEMTNDIITVDLEDINNYMKEN